MRSEGRRIDDVTVNPKMRQLNQQLQWIFNQELSQMS